MLLVLEDVHWADPSTLDLAVYLAQNLSDRSVVLLATYRADDPVRGPHPALRQRRAALGAALVLQLGPLDPGELAALLGDAPPAVRHEIAGRSEGNPFFAEELLQRQAGARCRRACVTCCSSGSPGSTAWPRGCCAWPRPPAVTSTTPCCAPRRRSQSTSSAPRFAPRSTMASSWPSSRAVASASVTPSWPRRSTPPSSPANAKSCMPGWPKRWRRARRRLAAPHWAAAGRRAEALVASVEAARQAQTVWALGESHAHLERALALWPEVPAAAALAQVDLAGSCAWAADVAWQAGVAPRAVELAEQPIDLDPPSGSVLYESLGGTSSPAAAVTKLWLPSSAPSSWCRPGRPRRDGPGRWLRSATG